MVFVPCGNIFVICEGNGNFFAFALPENKNATAYWLTHYKAPGTAVHIPFV